MGHVISEKGLKPDPEKLKAVRRFIGFTNYLSKFLPGLSDVCKPLWDLTGKDMEWFWTDVHNSAIDQVKQRVTSAPVLKYFDATKDTTLQFSKLVKLVSFRILEKEERKKKNNNWLELILSTLVDIRNLVKNS